MPSCSADSIPNAKQPSALPCADEGLRVGCSLLHRRRLVLQKAIDILLRRRSMDIPLRQGKQCSIS